MNLCKLHRQVEGRMTEQSHGRARMDIVRANVRVWCRSNRCPKRVIANKLHFTTFKVLLDGAFRSRSLDEDTRASGGRPYHRTGSRLYRAEDQQ